MNPNAEEIHEIAVTLESAQQKVRLYEAVQRLKENPDFQLVFMKEYFNEEAARLVHLRSDKNMRDEETQEELLKDIDAIGRCSNFLDTIRLLAGQAAKSIEDYEQGDEYPLDDDEATVLSGDTL